LAGHQVLEAADGNKALRICREEPVDLVVTDIHMPGKNGLELIRDLQRDLPRQKVLAMSGGAAIDANGDLYLARSLGALGTLRKPFSVKELLGAVNELLDEQN
jgi:DNA-binding response OmpR family regulator